MAMMDELLERYESDDQPLTKMDGYDDCLLGVVLRFGQPPILCYDRTKVLDKLVAGGMAHEDAVEWFEFNQIGAWVGDTTPCFLDNATD
jgi:hypothetical protein